MDHDSALTLFGKIISESPANWTRLLRTHVGFMEFVHRATEPLALPETVPLRDRIYAAVTSTSPSCPHGRLKTLKNVREGWKGCGRAGACACARELVSEANALTKARQRTEAEAQAAATASAATEDAGTKLRQLVETVPHKGLAARLLREPDVLAWIALRCPIDGLPMAERVYLALHGVETATCSRGNRRPFNTLAKGYRFCANDCACRREEQARKMTDFHRSSDRGDLSARTKEGLLRLHGVSNPMKVPGAADRRRETSRARYGAEYPLASPSVQAKVVATNMQRRGVAYPGADPAVQEKQRVTNMVRRGVPHSMGEARTAFAGMNGGLNPFQVPEIAAKAADTMMQRHGALKPLQVPDILARMQARFEEQHGARNPMLVPAIREKIEATVAARYGRASPNQAHFTDAAWAILQDKEAFRAMFEGRALREVAQVLGIAYDTCRKWCEKHGVELSKSTYEDAITDFLRSRGLLVERSNRRLIAPQEIDIVLPDLKVGIEFCGLYWHSDKHKRARRYHVEKTERMEALGWRLITIFEDEWFKSRPLVETRLMSVLGVALRGPGARALTIRRITAAEARTFLDRHHGQGGGAQGFAAYGAFSKEGHAPCAVMTFSSPRRFLSGRKDGPVELLRFATDGASYPGVASKLFAAFRNEHNPEAVVAYADRRWSSGGLYSALGFEAAGKSEAGYFYFHPNREIERLPRSRFMRHKIAHLVENADGMSEWAIMQKLGYLRIWDCGTLKFIWRRSPQGGASVLDERGDVSDWI